MADHTHIEWTDATWNPITGCSVVSAGCKHCYAMRLAGTRMRNHPSRAGLTIDTAAGPVWTGEVRLNENWLDQPLRWRRPRRIFVCAHGDLFHEAVRDEWIAAVFGVMAAAPHHTFQVLTKRPERMLRWFAWREEQIRKRDLQWEPWRVCEEEAAELVTDLPAIGCQSAWPLRNVWLGVSVENQDAADKRIPLLLQMPAAVRWISAEPLLGPVDLRDIDEGANRDIPREFWTECDDDDNPPAVALDAMTGLRWQRFGEWGERGSCIDWVVAGGESGANARPMHPDWARSLRDQCAAAGVPFLFKQWGDWLADDQVQAENFCAEHDEQVHDWDPFGHRMSFRVGKKAAGRLLDGVLHDAYPEVRS